MRLQKLDSSRHNPGRLEKPDRFSLESMVRGFFCQKASPLRFSMHPFGLVDFLFSATFTGRQNRFLQLLPS
jgi:hypothetical protein